MLKRSLFAVACMVGLSAVCSTALAVDVRVTIRNLSASDGVAFSPVNVIAHDGSVDTFDSGSAASAGVEDVAEMGGTTIIPGEAIAMQADALVTVVPATVGGVGPGVYPPGAEGSLVLSLDPTDNRYLSFLSMVVPSNDAFIGNDDATGIELFDAMGNFVATDFTLTGSNIWDAGTEINGLTGSAYVMGQDAALSPVEGGVVTAADLGTQFSYYLGETTAIGATFQGAPMAATPVASFSFEVVPEPSALLLSCIGAVVLSRRRGR